MLLTNLLFLIFLEDDEDGTAALESVRGYCVVGNRR